MPSIADIKKQYPDLSPLDDNQVVDALHQAFYADLPREQVAASLGIEAPPEAVKPRTWGEAAKDTGAALMQGGAGLVKSAGDLYGVAAGDMNNPVSQIAGDAQEYWQDAKSDPLKKKMAARDANIKAQDGLSGKAWTAFKDTVTDPALAMDTVAGNAATMIPGAVVGRGVAAGMTARSLAMGPITEAASAAAAKAAGSWGTASAIAAGGVQQGADVSSNVYDSAMKKPEAVWDTNPDFVAKVQALGGNTPENRQAVKNELATTAARMTFPAATGISLAANAIPGATMLERALVGGAAKDTIKAGVKYGLPKAIAKGAVGEAGQEFIEEGGGQVAGNIANQSYVDPNQDLTDQVGENAGMGAAGGFLLGAGGGAFHDHAPHVEEKGPLSRGANAGIDAAGPPPAAPAPIVMTPEQEQTLLAHANTRAQQLTDKANGTKDIKTNAPDGTPVTLPGQTKQFLTPVEKDEAAFLQEHGGNAQELVHTYPGLLAQPTATPEQPVAAPDIKLSEASTTDQATYEAATQPTEVASGTTPTAVKPEAATAPAARPALSDEDKHAILFSNKSVADGGIEHKGTQDGDILNGLGKPYATRMAAQRCATMEGKDWRVTPVFDGFVARRKDAANGTTAATTGLDTGAAAGADHQPAGSRADPLVQPVPGADASGNVPAAPDGRSQADNAVVDASAGAASVATTGNIATPAALPKALAGAKPRYSFGARQFTLTFASDVDRAAYITSQTEPSKRDGDYLNFVMQLTGMTKEQVISHGNAVKASIKAQAKDSKETELTVQAIKHPALAVQDGNIATPKAEAPAENEQWTRMPQAERQALTQRAGMAKMISDKIARTAWADITPKTRARIEAVMVETVSQPQEKPLEPTPLISQQAAQEGQKTPEPAAEGVAPEFVKIKTIDGMNTYVRKADLEGDAKLLRMFTSTGKSNGRIHRDNLDPTGKKQAAANAENAGNPFFDVITNKQGGTFDTVVAARRALNQKGLQSTHIVAKASDVSVGATGFVVRKKAVSPAVTEQATVAESASPIKEYGAGFEPVGARAFAEGKPRLLPTELRGLKEISQEWYRGWDTANADAPVRNTQTANAPVDGRERNSPPMQELDGFKVGDVVDVPNRTTGRSKVTRLYTTRMTGFTDPIPMATIEHSGGKTLDLNASELRAVVAEVEKPAKAFIVPKRGPDGGVQYAAEAVTPAATPSKVENASITEVAVGKPDPLTEKEKAAKAKMFGALGKLAALAGKNTRMNWTPEEEQQLLPIVIELFDGAMELGSVTFQKAVRYVREFISGNLDQETADAIPFETLQGAYIHTARKFKDQGATSGKEVMSFDSLAELEKSGEQADTDAKDTPNAARKLDSTSQGPLAGAPAETIPGAEKDGPTAAGADTGGRTDGTGNEVADGSGSDTGRGLPGGAGAVPVSTRGAGKQPRSTKKPGVQGNAGGQSGLGFTDTSGGTGGLIPVNPAPNAVPIAAPAFTPTDFTIEDDFALGEGGPKAKFKGNIEAVKTLQLLDAEGRMATPTEQSQMARYVGWGGLTQSFDADNKDWSKEYAELKGLMSEDDYADARVSTRYAHFTSRQVIQDGIYAALKHMGFNGGRALEGGAGVGNFMGLMPTDMRSASRFTAIEREPFSAKIAKHLYPQQNVQEADFTEFVGNDDFYDVAVGNPPFASDPQVDRSGRKHLSGLSLHNYFFAKEVDMLRDGGILAQVVTNSFLDATTDTARTYIADKTKFLGAIRLPNNAFSKNANTEVTTDLIFLQKRPESEWGGKSAKADAKHWLGVGEFKDKEGRTVPLNQYFIDNPDMMLGKFGAYGTMYRGESPALVLNPGQDTAAMLKVAVAKLPAGIYVDRAITATANMQDALVKTLTQPSVHEGGYFEEDGKLFQRIKDIAGEARGKEITPLTQWTEKTKLGDAGFARIKSLSSMRATVRSLLAAELSNDAKMVDLRKTLNEQYDAYAKAHGLINDPGTLRVFDDDPDFPLLASLEHGYTPAIGLAAAKSMGIKMVPSKATKGPIFTQRVIDARQQVAKVETPADALAVSMAERGKLDSAYIGELLGRDSDEVLQDLAGGDRPLLFKDPATGEYALRDAYLSGNVRAKLVQAKQAGMFNNIKALEAVQPEDVGSHEIVARVGSPWVPESVYQDFAKMLFGEGTNASIKYVKLTAGYSAYVTAGSSTANTNTWGTASYPGADILSALLNNKPVRVTYKDGDGKTHVDATATENANAKAQDMRNKFQDWLFSDGDRAELLGRAYNDTNNNYVTREFDGEWMTFPGKVPNAIVKFRRHQRNAIARIVQDRTALLDHVVGSGKTYTVIAAAMELRRTGLARKPMIAVPNHLVKQWASDFYKLYPGANILTATKKDFEKTNRRKFLAKIATGDWDAVIIAHSSFGFIKPAPDFEHQFNNKQIANIVKTINEVENGDGDKQQKKRTVKQLEGIKERLENRIKSLRDKPMDALLDFGELGVDQLFVDEAHMFKNLMFSTKMQNIAGLGDSKGSQRAYDMYVKANQIFAQNGRGQGLVFATGTPVSNSLAEMYHMMRYLMPAQMEEMGFESFDAWANTYASVEQVWMQKASGDGFKAQNRMSNFVNTPELLKVFDQVSDTVTMDDIKAAYREENDGKEFPLPKLKGGKRSPVSLRKSAGQEAYMATVAARALALEQRRGPPQKGEDNILVIMSDARKAAMDIRLVDPTVTEREPGGRIDRASQEIFSRYKQYDAVKGTQLVFSDLGTPLKTAKKELVEYEALKDRIEAGTGDEVMQRAALGDEAAQDKVDDAEDAQAELDAKGRDWLGAMQAAERGFSVYDDLKAALIEKGIPEQEIAFIHDYNTDEQKAGLFRKMNAGQIRVLVGSTPKLGAGTNVQERLVALHHLDVPWKPSDVEQREGRIIRQGNSLMGMPDFEVEVLAYVTQDTLDMRMWQVQETKLKMINQLRTRKIGREVENAFEDLELSAGEMQAAATGNIDLLREIQIKGEIKKLEQRKRAFDAQKSDLQNRKKSVEQKIATLPDKIESSKVMADGTDLYRAELADQAEQFKATIDGKEFTNAKEAGAVLLGMIDAHVYMQRQEDGKFGGKQLTEAEVAKEPVQDPKAADYSPWSKRPVPLSVNFNGEDFKSRDKLAEAFSNAHGDRDPIAWKLDGTTLNRRTLIESGIRNAVAEAIAEEQVKEIGTLGPFSVSVEGQSSRNEKVLDVMLSYGGKTISNARGLGTVDEATTERNVPIVVRMAENMASSARQQYDYEMRQLEQAKKEQAELDATPLQGEWPEQAKLEEMRQKHKEVLQRLSGAGVKATLDGETLHGAMGIHDEGIRDDADVVFSRTTTQSTGLPIKQVQSIVDRIASRWANAPEIVVAASMSDQAIPQAVRDHDQKQKSLGATGEPEGFVYGGKVYLLAGQITSPGDVVQVLLHEALGHIGLRGAFDGKLVPILKQIAVLRKAEVSAKARQYGLDMSIEADRIQAAEEVLAEMAQTRPELGFVKRAIAAIRNWLRANVPGFNSMKLTDADIIEKYILPARNHVENGGKTGNIATAPAFSRSIGEALTSGINNVQDVKLAAGYQVSDLFQSSGRLHWWHKSVGTMYHLAQKSPPFQKVYDSIQNFLNDVSFYAAEAADLAPNILPKLDKISDVFKSPLSAADTQSLSGPVFQGTLSWGRDENGTAKPLDQIEADMGAMPVDAKAHRLLRDGLIDAKVLRMWQGLPMDKYESLINSKFEKEVLKPGIVFTPAELKQHFKMTDAQVALYQEFRKATDKSIDNLAISEMLNYAGKDVDVIKSDILASSSVDEAGQVLRDYLVSLTELEPERDAALSATAAKMLDIAAHASDMKKRGYAPLSRFGSYTLEATLETGERYFSLFETERERNKMTRMLTSAGAAGIKTGTMSQQAYKLLNGVSPETAALFGEMLGLQSQGSEAKDLAFQEFIKRGTANRSAMKRLLHRKGIAGFSEDAGRVLAGFIYSNGRKTASNLHAKETASAVNDIPKEQGELKDAAVKLQEYVSSPQEEAQGFRGLLFAQYLGGSVASAMVNATQPFAVTFPYLSQYGGMRKAAAQMVAAARDAAKEKTGDARLDAALKLAEEEGIVSPQEVHALQAQAMGRSQLRSGDGTVMGDSLAKGSNALSKLSLAWGKVFSIAEQFNRRTTFIAAYRTAIAQGIANPAKFAEKAVSETQFTYNKGNKPQWARGAVGSVLFTFKQYSVNYLELVTRMATAGEPGSAERMAGQKAAVLAIAILFLMAGSDGLPFMENIEDVLDGAMQRLGYNFSSKQKMKEFLALQLGKDGAEFITSGLSGVPGMPIDVSGRLGMGKLIPGTGLFQKKTDYTRDLMELAGPGGDMAKRLFNSLEQAVSGNISSAVTTVAPVAARNVVKAVDMGNTGMYRDDKGRKVIETTPAEAVLKGIGFQPRSVKNVQDASAEVQRAKAQYTLAAGEIRQKMAQAIFGNDSDMKQSARDDIAAWNAHNPEQNMTLNMPAVLSKVREMRKSKEQRMTDTAPRAIRAQVRTQLKEELY